MDARARLKTSLRFFPGPLAPLLRLKLPEVDAAASALWRRDPSLWSKDPATEQTIANRLGWLSSPSLMAASIDRLRTFAAAVKDEGFTDVVLLGMGGSSLAPEVLRAVVGVAPGWPALHMLDSTDPAAVRAVSTPPDRTLYLLASKSGTTIEPNSLASHFRACLESRVPRWADHFVAITDEGTELARRARAEEFRELFINPSDIGGRYSAMSYFGLVPAALMGQDLGDLVGWSLAMLSASQSADGAMENPSTALGLAIGAAAAAGRNKLTLIMPAAIEPFGLWIEQLIAESTGKQGVGIVPIAGESIGSADQYGNDRVFVRFRVPWVPLTIDATYDDEVHSPLVRELEKAGAPIVDIDWLEPTAVGAEFVRWEIATAIVGAMLRINPFDEPNVQQAKDATRTLLDGYQANGRLPTASPDHKLPDGISVTLSKAAREELRGGDREAILTLIRPGDYFALLAFLGPDGSIADELTAFRNAVRDRTGAATMFGYGPRYLHSTGQLHKGGPNTGVFVLLTADPVEDVAIPGKAFSFGTLELAQALGDFLSLEDIGRRAVHVHLPRPDAQLVRRVAEAMLGGLPQRSA